MTTPDKDIARPLDSTVGTTRKAARDASRTAGCLAPDLLAGWETRILSPEELRIADAHLGHCNDCLSAALDSARLMTRLDAGAALPVPRALRARVASRWTSARSESLATLVIRLARTAMTLVERHVVAPVIDIEELVVALPAVRTGQRTDAVSFRLRAPEGQICATVFTEGAAVGLTVTLLGNADDVLGGQRVFLRRHGRSIYSARTDAAGALTMPPIEPGVYEVSCPGIGTSFRLDLRR